MGTPDRANVLETRRAPPPLPSGNTVNLGQTSPSCGRLSGRKQSKADGQDVGQALGRAGDSAQPAPAAASAFPLIGAAGSFDSPGSITNVYSSEYQGPSTPGSGAGSSSWRT